MTDPRQVLARTCYGEARSEGKRGMEAVASVVLNRARNPRWWGRSIVQVCLQRWQFSVWNPDNSQRRLILAVSESDRHFRTALGIADEAIAGKLKDETKNSDHYHTHSARPLWSQGRQPVFTLGNHRFFRLELREPPKVTDKVDVKKLQRHAPTHNPNDNDLLEAEDD